METSANILSAEKPVSSETSKCNFLLHLADTTLILAQRNAEWCGHGPVLEQDIAITNISLDLIGQARNFYQYAAELIGENATEDSLAYLRTEREFKNLLLVEQPNGDWAQTILRQYFFSQFQYLLFEKLQNSTDEQIAAIATKALKEISYHVRWTGEWLIRLGDGTEESHQRMKKAIDELWQYTGEMFIASEYEKQIFDQKVSVDIAELKASWEQKIRSVFAEATLDAPPETFMQTGGKHGVHTEYMRPLLAELQYLQRTYPGCKW